MKNNCKKYVKVINTPLFVNIRGYLFLLINGSAMTNFRRNFTTEELNCRLKMITSQLKSTICL